MAMQSPAFSFEIKKLLGVISKGSGGWTKELNLVSWNGKEAKFDIRDWDPDHERMTKGVTLSAKELIALRDLLNSLEIEE